MPKAIRTPRVNNNDDLVRLVYLAVKVGAEVHPGDLLAEVETDKANFSVESEDKGFVLAICHKLGEEISVGSVLLWLGNSVDESVPINDERDSSKQNISEAGASLKARLLLQQYNLDESTVPRTGQRLSGEDVEHYIKHNRLRRPQVLDEGNIKDESPAVSGRTESLKNEERAMLRSVLWHRTAVPGYVELAYDTRPWIEYAAEFRTSYHLMFDPLLAVMAFRLAALAREHPLLNSTINGNSRYIYDHVNLGFTVQSGAILYMVVVQNAETIGEKEFVDKLLSLQLAAAKKALRSDQASGATVAFTTMARWSIARHIPVLPPHVSLIVAHAGTAPDGFSHLGATYDHRVLTGFDVAQLLNELSRPTRLERDKK